MSVDIFSYKGSLCKVVKATYQTFTLFRGGVVLNAGLANLYRISKLPSLQVVIITPLKTMVHISRLPGCSSLKGMCLVLTQAQI